MTPKCKAHTSLKNLQNITSNLRKVLSQGDNISTDWDKEKKVHSGKYGYLDTATNFPEILEETEIIKRLVRSFNKSRVKLSVYKDTILCV